MSGDIAKRIFAKFLKENKLMGIALVYYFGKSKHPTISPSNIKILNESARKADKEIDVKLISQHLIDMVGKTITPNIMLKRFKNDYLYDIYILWKDYVESNMYSIHKKYYQKQNE